MLPRRFGALLISGALVASFAGLALANPASAAPTAPGENFVLNKDCADFAPDGVTWEEFKIEGVPENGEHKILGTELVVTIANTSSQSFDWASNFDMSAVLVKGSPGGIYYQYPGANDRSDTGLHALVHEGNLENPYYGISHVSFCYKIGGDTPPVVTEPVTPEPVTPAPETPAPETPAPETPVAPQVLPQASVQPSTQVLGETLVQDATLPRTGAAATHTLVLVGGLGLAFGLMMLTLARRRTVAVHRS
jgi:LPXTG-motif cell wall-anchored protein